MFSVKKIGRVQMRNFNFFGNKSQFFFIIIRMLKYIFNQQYRKAHNFLSQLGLFSDQYKFRSLGFDNVRKTVLSLQLNMSVSFFSTCFNILKEKPVKSIIMLKTLMFIHFILQTSIQKCQQMYQLLRKQIIILLRISRNISKQSPYQKLSFSLVQPIQKIQNNLIKQDTHNVMKKYSSSVSFYDFERIKGPESSESIKKNQNVDEKVLLQRYFCENFIQPYGVYLLKQESVMKSINQQIVDEFSIIWTQINLLKLLFKISKGLNTMSIYYRGRYMETITNLIEIINFDIHQFYGCITSKIKELINIIIEECELRQQMEKQKKIFMEENIFTLSVSEKKNHKRQNSNGISHLKSEEYANSQIFQLQELLKQLFDINDKILYIYSAKYIKKQLQTIKVKSPPIMRLQNHEYSFVFKKILQQNKKSKKLKKLQIYRNLKPQLNQLLQFSKNFKFFGVKSLKGIRDVQNKLEGMTQDMEKQLQIQQSPLLKPDQSETCDKQERVETAVDEVQQIQAKISI